MHVQVVPRPGSYGGVVVGVFVIAGVVATAAGPFEGIEFAPAGSPEPTVDIDCRGDDVTRMNALGDRLNDIPEIVHSPSNVPDDVRWLWPKGVAPDPLNVWAMDTSDRIAAYNELYRDCLSVAGESVVLTSAIDDGTQIWRTIYIERVPEPAVDDRLSEGITEQVQVGDVTVTVHNRGELSEEGGLWSRLTASWSDGADRWYVAAEPLAYDQLAELVERVSFTDGAIDLGGWSVAKDSDFVDHGVSRTHSSYAGSAAFEVDAESTWLSAHDEPRSMWLGMPAGSKLVQVNGRTAVIDKYGSKIRWQPEDGITLELGRLNGSRAELVNLAEKVRRASADDPRLGDHVWQR